MAIGNPVLEQDLGYAFLYSPIAVNVKERAAETGEPRSTIYYQANLFDQAGSAQTIKLTLANTSGVSGHFMWQKIMPL